MPPGPAFNWLCVAHSVTEILSNAAQIKAAQYVAPRATLNAVQPRKRRRLDANEPSFVQKAKEVRIQKDIGDTEVVQAGVELKGAKLWVEENAKKAVEIPLQVGSRAEEKLGAFNEQQRLDVHESEDVPSPATEPQTEPPSRVLPAEGASYVSSQDELRASTLPQSRETNPELVLDSFLPNEDIAVSSTPTEPMPARKLQSSKVPSSRLGRLFHYGGLAASLGYGAASELIRRSTSSSESSSSSLMMTEGNIKLLVSKLTQMRGAALKIGQFMSIQDSHVLPPEIEDIFRRVQDSAHYMPDWQMEEVLQSSLGASWASHFTSFDRLPFAAASIGQVHSAVLAAHSSPTGKDEPVAVKIQFPNIVDSIDSDLSYVKLLLTAGKLLPKGLFLDRTIEVMKAELADECDYKREASFLSKFGLPSFLGDNSKFKVPWVWKGSTDRVLVMERVEGVSVGGSVIDRLTQQDRNDIAGRIIELCLKELFVFRVMQTDPNWTNFLWNGKTRQVELVDFGATREYSKEFIDNWLRLLQAAASDDRGGCVEWSLKLGYLTGKEDEAMLDAHTKSMTLLATPFKATTPQPFAFGPGSSWANITSEIRAQIPAMLAHRLTPPPRETYSLNRKLSGAFLLAARLNAKVDCGNLWNQVVDDYQFDP